MGKWPIFVYSDVTCQQVYVISALYIGACIVLLSPIYLGWSPPVAAFPLSTVLAPNNEAHIRFSSPSPSAVQVTTARTPLGGALLHDTLYRQMLYAAIAQIITQSCYTYILGLLGQSRFFAYLAALIFLGGNLACTLWCTDEALFSSIYLLLMSCSRIGGVAALVSYLTKHASFDATSGFSALAAFAMSCLSVICDMYANYCQDDGLRSVLVGVRVVCLLTYFGILAFLTFGAITAKASKLRPNVHTAMKMLLNFMFPVLYFIIAPGGGVGYHSDRVVLVNVLWIFMAFFAMDALDAIHMASKAPLQQALLAKVFPEYILPKLLSANGAKPKSNPRVHLNSTFFFSDVVSYCEIAEDIGPLESLLLLDDLFTVMDQCAIACKVVKVETIGDAYMVVSTDMDDVSEDSTSMDVSAAEHAARVCRFALMVRTAVAKLMCRGGRKVQLRMGIHTGSCVSGIVGHEMPRYCFFGDTINQAHRLESTSHTGLIQVSSVTAALLQHTHDEFVLQQRAEPVKLKGIQGEQTTFWLERQEEDSISPSRANDKSTSKND